MSVKCAHRGENAGSLFIQSNRALRSSNPATTRLHLPVIQETYFSGTLRAGRNSHTATLLPDGRVLLVGGAGGAASSAQIYDYNSP
jgi:hypothetical protein